MGRRRRNKSLDVAELIGSLVALAILSKLFFGVDLFGWLLAPALQILIFSALVAGACAVVFVIWKVVNVKSRWDAPVSTPVGTTFTAVPDELDEMPTLDVGACLDKLDWFQLEKLIAVLFQGSQYRVESRGGAQPDGGIDLVVETGETRIAVQCKKWTTWKCGVAVVRELMGSMIHEGIGQGYLVAREVTAEARELAGKHSIGLIEREDLVKWIGEVLASGNAAVLSALENPEKLCPKCGSRMVVRTASKGRSAGSEFWGCSTFPRCRATMH